MFRSIFRNSSVLHSAFLATGTAAVATVATSTAHQQQSTDADASSTAAALWHQASVHHSSSADSDAAVSHANLHHHQHDAGQDDAAAHFGSNNALVLASNNQNFHQNSMTEDAHLHSEGASYVGFSSGFGPRHLADVAVLSSDDHVTSRRSNSDSSNVHEAVDRHTDTSPNEQAHSSISSPSPVRRPVITKARRIRLAAAASQSAEVLQAVGTPATALLHSQRVQQLQAEEALLNASLQRLKAERDLAKVRHTFDEELHNFQFGVAQLERAVLQATNPKMRKSGGKKEGSVAAGTGAASVIKRDPVVSYSQESGGGLSEVELGETAEADLLGMSATADAEAAAAAAAAASSRKKKVVTSARVKLHRQSRAAQARGSVSAVPVAPSSPSAATPAPYKERKTRSSGSNKKPHPASSAKTARRETTNAPLRVKSKASRGSAVKAVLKSKRKAEPKLVLRKQMMTPDRGQVAPSPSPSMKRARNNKKREKTPAKSQKKSPAKHPATAPKSKRSMKAPAKASLKKQPVQSVKKNAPKNRKPGAQPSWSNKKRGKN